MELWILIVEIFPNEPTRFFKELSVARLLTVHHQVQSQVCWHTNLSWVCVSECILMGDVIDLCKMKKKKKTGMKKPKCGNFKQNEWFKIMSVSLLLTMFERTALVKAIWQIYKNIIFQQYQRCLISFQTQQKKKNMGQGQKFVYRADDVQSLWDTEVINFFLLKSKTHVRLIKRNIKRVLGA